MELPKINRIVKREARSIKLLGLNTTDNYNSGALSFTKNISSRRYPYITQRMKRTVTGTGCTSLSSWNELVTVKNGVLYYGTRTIGTVGDNTNRQFAMINTKLVLWPDKKYLDLNTMQLVNLEQTVTSSTVTFTEETITTDGSVDLRTIFTSGDGLTISGCIQYQGNNRDKENPVTVTSVASNKLTFTLPESRQFTAGTETVSVTIKRPVPDMDFICESENRIWGVSNTDKTIYASALGDPCTFYDYSGEATDSFSVAVGSAGNFTGCCKVGTSVCFWKERTMHKMLGSYPEEYQLYTYEFDGIGAGNNKSVVALNETVYYAGVKGVYGYSGASPQLISSALGDTEWSNVVAGTDGRVIYFSAVVGTENRLYTYDTMTGLWLLEDDLRATDFTYCGHTVYCRDNTGKIVNLSCSEEDSTVQWELDFKPIYESVSGAYNSSSLLFVKKKYSRLVVRMELAAGSTVTCYVKCDNDEWKNCGSITGSYESIREFVVPINRCDKFEMKLTGTGPCVIENFERLYHTGSAR